MNLTPPRVITKDNEKAKETRAESPLDQMLRRKDFMVVLDVMQRTGQYALITIFQVAVKLQPEDPAQRGAVCAFVEGASKLTLSARHIAMTCRSRRSDYLLKGTRVYLALMQLSSNYFVERLD